MQELPKTIFPHENCTALVTGGSQGIGWAITEKLIAAGVHVFATTRSPAKAPMVENVTWLEFEGSKRETCLAFIEKHQELLSSVNLLVNNAGAGLFGSIAHHSHDSIEAQFQLLLQSPVALTRACLPAMQARQSGAIVNISSLASQLPMPYSTCYNSAKAGLSAFTRSLILEAEQPLPFLIDFQPGDFKTAFNDHTEKPDSLEKFSSARLRAAWTGLEKNLNSAPLPQKAANDLMKVLNREKSGEYYTGDFFQCRVAPLGVRLFSQPCIRKLIAAYYRLPKA